MHKLPQPRIQAATFVRSAGGKSLGTRLKLPLITWPLYPVRNMLIILQVIDDFID